MPEFSWPGRSQAPASVEATERGAGSIFGDGLNNRSDAETEDGRGLEVRPRLVPGVQPSLEPADHAGLHVMALDTARPDTDPQKKLK